MTTHEFAHQLLEGPNIPIVIPKVLQFATNEDDNLADPEIYIALVALDANDPTCEVEAAIISYGKIFRKRK